MAYKIYICRAEKPANAPDDPITLDEWKNVVRDIPEIHLYEGDEALPPHVEPPTPSEGLARWAGHPLFDAVWLNHKDGVIYTKGYDAYVNMRMRVLANRLRARVMDEDGRIF